MARLFVAIHPPPHVRAPIAECQQGLVSMPRARLVPTTQLHVTLRFLADFPDEAIDHLKSNLARVDVPAFDVTLAGVGTFGRPPHVVWLGVEPNEAVARLADAVQTVIDRPPEERKFRPHLTLARIQNPSPFLMRAFVESNQTFSVPWCVDSFHLFESRLAPAGATHTCLATFPLRPSEA